MNTNFYTIIIENIDVTMEEIKDKIKTRLLNCNFEIYNFIDNPDEWFNIFSVGSNAPMCSSIVNAYGEDEKVKDITPDEAAEEIFTRLQANHDYESVHEMLNRDVDPHGCQFEFSWDVGWGRQVEDAFNVYKFSAKDRKKISAELYQLVKDTIVESQQGWKEAKAD